MTERSRILFALPFMPDVFVEETGQTHALTPIVMAMNGQVEIGVMLDAHLHEADDALCLCVPLQDDNPPLIVLYRCLRLLACHQRFKRGTINRVLKAVANNQPLAGLEDRWSEILSSCPPVSELCAALDAALQSGLSILSTLCEIYEEMHAGRLIHDRSLEAFGIFNAAEVHRIAARFEGLHLCLEGPMCVFLQEQQGSSSPQQANWMILLAVSFERMFDCRLVHALGLVLLLWKRIPAMRCTDPVDVAEAAKHAVSLMRDTAEVMADALWADEEARVILPPAHCQSVVPLPVAMAGFKTPFTTT